MSAWSKVVLGWVTPTVVSSSGSYSLRQACDNPDIIMINEGYPNQEYLLIENRQPCDFDATMPQGGLAIFHIDGNANNVLGHPGQSNWPGNGNHYEGETDRNIILFLCITLISNFMSLHHNTSCLTSSGWGI